MDWTKALNSTVITEAAAQSAHEANRAYCEALGDYSQLPWDRAPDWIRASAVEGVKAVFRGAGPEEAHQTWCEGKLRDGWVYGETKDAESKTHPCLVPYEDLPLEQKLKDDLFVESARLMARILISNGRRRESGMVTCPSADEIRTTREAVTVKMKQVKP